MDCNRKFPRVPIHLAIKYEVVKWNENPHHPQKALVAESQNLSLRGIGFSHDLDLPEKTIKKLREGSLKLNLEFTLPNDSTPVNLLGRMIYCGEEDDEETEVNKLCMGILFIDIDPKDYVKISEYVKANLPEK